MFFLCSFILFLRVVDLAFILTCNLFKFVAILCMVCVCFFLKISPIKKTIAKKSSKRQKFNDNTFKDREAFERHSDIYSGAVIIVEREVNLESLSHTFILDVFIERAWSKLLSGFARVWEPITQKFFANDRVEDEHLNCWV